MGESGLEGWGDDKSYEFDPVSVFILGGRGGDNDVLIPW